jgi:hypothetical protein
MPRGGWLREVRRWACCGLRRAGGPSPELWGVFIIAVHRAFVLGLGARHRGIVKLLEDVVRCVTVFACFTYLLTITGCKSGVPVKVIRGAGKTRQAVESK